MLGVVLAGGASARMGRDKATVVVGDRTMLEHVVSVVESVCDRVVISGRSEGIGPHQAVEDDDDGTRGNPLAGIATVAALIPDQPLLAVGVDQPWVRSETLRRLGATFQGLPVVPVDDGFRQPLCAAYPAGLGDLARRELDAGGSLQSLLDVTSYDAISDWASWGEDGRSWYSADTMQRVDEGIRRFGLP